MMYLLHIKYSFVCIVMLYLLHIIYTFVGIFMSYLLHIIYSFVGVVTISIHKVHLHQISVHFLFIIY